MVKWLGRGGMDGRSRPISETLCWGPETLEAAYRATGAKTITRCHSMFVLFGLLKTKYHTTLPPPSRQQYLGIFVWGRESVVCK